MRPPASSTPSPASRVRPHRAARRDLAATPIGSRSSSGKTGNAGTFRQTRDAASRASDRLHDATARTDMNEMEAGAGLAGESRWRGQSLELRADWARVRKSRAVIPSSPRRARASSPVVRHGRRPAGSGARPRACLPPASCISVGKTPEPRVAHERLEAHHTALGHRRHMMTDPESDRPEPEVGRRTRLQRLGAFDRPHRRARCTVSSSGACRRRACRPCSERATSVPAPSHSVCPGSLKCRCTSMTPGKM